MLDFFRSGGIAMIALLLFSAAALRQNFRFARQPREAHAGSARAWTQAVLFATITAVAFNIRAVCTKVPANEEWANSPDLPLILLVGLGESLAPAVLGGAVLATCAVFSAIGWRRMDAA